MFLVNKYRYMMKTCADYLSSVTNTGGFVEFVKK